MQSRHMTGLHGRTHDRDRRRDLVGAGRGVEGCGFTVIHKENRHEGESQEQNSLEAGKAQCGRLTDYCQAR